MNTTRQPENTQGRKWLTVEEAARYLGCNRNFLDRDRMTRLHGIKFARLGRHVRYLTVDLDEFLLKSRGEV